jgi:hypothetical protein
MCITCPIMMHMPYHDGCTLTGNASLGTHKCFTCSTNASRSIMPSSVWALTGNAQMLHATQTLHRSGNRCPFSLHGRARRRREASTCGWARARPLSQVPREQERAGPRQPGYLKRPSIELKETYYRVKRDLVQSQKKPSMRDCCDNL